MSQTVSPSTSRCYGLARVSRAWSVSRAGVYRFLKGAPSPAIARRRPGPTGPRKRPRRGGHGDLRPEARYPPPRCLPGRTQTPGCACSGGQG